MNILTRKTPLETKNTQHWATVLYQARKKAQPLSQISKEWTDLTRPQAYEIQEKGILHRLKDDHEKWIGFKMGLTSEAKRKQMNLDAPLYGELTDKMQVADGGTYRLPGQIHPKIEPEVAFLISKELSGKVTHEQVLESCSAVAACMEILDSRYEHFKYFSMEDVIADNSSSSQFVVGPWEKNFRSMDLKNLKMQMYVNNELAQSGNSIDISGDPVISVIQLCELLALRGRKLPAGSIVLAGAATAAVELQPKMNVRLKVDSLPEVSINVANEAL